MEHQQLKKLVGKDFVKEMDAAIGFIAEFEAEINKYTMRPDYNMVMVAMEDLRSDLECELVTFFFAFKNIGKKKPTSAEQVMNTYFAKMGELLDLDDDDVNKKYIDNAAADETKVDEVKGATQNLTIRLKVVMLT